MSTKQTSKLINYLNGIEDVTDDHIYNYFTKNFKTADMRKEFYKHANQKLFDILYYRMLVRHKLAEIRPLKIQKLDTNTIGV